MSWSFRSSQRGASSGVTLIFCLKKSTLVANRVGRIHMTNFEIGADIFTYEQQNRSPLNFEIFQQIFEVFPDDASPWAYLKYWGWRLSEDPIFDC